MKIRTIYRKHLWLFQVASDHEIIIASLRDSWEVKASSKMAQLADWLCSSALWVMLAVMVPRHICDLALAAELSEPQQ